MPSFLYLARVSSSSRFVWPSLALRYSVTDLDNSQALFEGFFVDECRVDVFDVSGRIRNRSPTN